MTQWEYRIEFIDLYVSQRDPKPEFTFIQEISGVGVGQLYTDSLENRKVMRFNFNSEAALFVDMASSNHGKHLSILNSHHEFVRFIKSKLRVVAACVEPTAYDS